MSAFVCSSEHFIALAEFAASQSPMRSGVRVNPRYFKQFTPEQQQLFGHDLAEFYANILFSENVRSVEYRYPGNRQLPGPVNMPDAIKIRPHKPYNLNFVDLLKMCDGLEYQSCETPDYYESVGYELLQAIRKSLIRCLPGYDEGPWAFSKAA